MSWEDILKRKIFEEEVPKWLEQYANIKDNETVVIENNDVTGHALKRMMGYDSSTEPRNLKGAFFFKNMLKKFNEIKKTILKLKKSVKFTVYANGYAWGISKKEDKYTVTTYIGEKEADKYQKRIYNLGYVDADTTEVARSREELIELNKIPVEKRKIKFNKNKIKNLINQDPMIRHYNVNVENIVEKLISFNNYEEVISFLDASIEKEKRPQIKQALRHIKGLISNINKSQNLHIESWEDVLKRKPSRSERTKQKYTYKVPEGVYTNPTLRAKIHRRLWAKNTHGTGKYQWSARKSQELNRLYQKEGGGFVNKK